MVQNKNVSSRELWKIKGKMVLIFWKSAIFERRDSESVGKRVVKQMIRSTTPPKTCFRLAESVYLGKCRKLLWKVGILWAGVEKFLLTRWLNTSVWNDSYFQFLKCKPTPVMLVWDLLQPYFYMVKIVKIHLKYYNFIK